MNKLPEPINQLYPFQQNAYPTLWGNMNYVDHGSGHPVVMLHGNPTWSFMWRNLIRALESDFRCIAPDHIGCGLSDKPQSGFGYRLAEHIDNVVGLLDDQLKIDAFDLVVHDWGGAIGMGVAQRLAQRVRKIVLFNTAAFRSKQIPWKIAVCRTPVIGESIVRGLNVFAAAAARTCVEKPLPEDVRSGYLYPYQTWHDRVAVHRFVKDIPMRETHPSFKTLTDIEEGLGSLANKPIQILWGKKDWCFGQDFLDHFLGKFPQAQLKAFQEAGHYLLEDEPGAVESIGQFLRAPIPREQPETDSF